MVYTPHPIDTGAVALSPQLLELSELLAENVHDLWAVERMKQGWTHGPSRSDARKEHPDLVPYAELPESEKLHDRATALGTLKAILALGYEIVPPRKTPVDDEEDTP